MPVASVAQKSPEAFRTISEVAAELDVPQHVLRFWETKFTTVKPLKRGGGRRYYRPDDLDLLKGIRTLLYRDGLTIKGVQKILREQGPRHVMELGRGSRQFSLSRNEEGGGERDLSSNVHPFAREGADPHGRLSKAGRARLCELLDELVALKARLADARRPIRS